VILSDKGWVRAAKGHDVDVTALSYKAGDGYLTHASGRSNQQAVFLSTLGRTYALEAHSLPSARSQGEPLTGRFALGGGEEMRHLLMGHEGEPYLISTDAGYGFVCAYDDLIGKNKNGKVLLTVPEGSLVLPPQKIGSPTTDLCMVISNEGRMLLFPLNTLPVLNKGKGNKLISIASARVKAREEFVVMAVVIPLGQSVTLFAGKRKLTLKPSDLDCYRGERGRRGAKLPRGLQRVDRIDIEPVVTLDAVVVNDLIS
jgi:topoisomerase-4 subunit A